MRTLLRNAQPIFFRRVEGQQEIIDEYGNSTGIYAPQYSDLMAARLVVSPNKGTSESDQFGSFADYDRTATTADTRCLIDEDTILWVDGADTDGPHNYIVKKVARWKNSIQFAIAEVKVSAQTQSEP